MVPAPAFGNKAGFGHLRGWRIGFISAGQTRGAWSWEAGFTRPKCMGKRKSADSALNPAAFAAVL
jgi:hypothetical protein